MTANCEALDLPTDHSKNVIEEVVKNEKFKDFKITVTHGSSKGDNYLGEIFRAVVKGVRENGTKDSLRFIIKMSPRSLELRKAIPVALFYQRESYAYSKMLPTLDKIQDDYDLSYDDRFRYATLYRSESEEGNEMLIFEDLVAKGFQMYNRLMAFDYDHLSLCIKNLARFHATSIVLRARDPEVFNEIASHTSNELEFGDNFESYMERSKAKIMSVIEDKDDCEKITNYFPKMKSELERFVKSETAAPYNVLCHGDCWNNNFLFMYKDGKVAEIRMIDWQIIRCASPITDIAYMLFMGTDKSMRSKHYEEILNLYYDTLNYNVSKMGYDLSKYYPENIYRDHIKHFMAYGLILSFCVLPLTLSNVGQAPNIEDIMLKGDDDKEEIDVVYSDLFKERMKDVVRFSIENNII